eukprot:GEZU01010317.1.p1 GENE.GEZU01010317.1~~GEZU01010317.1.p1  ORF type:complete len:187 (-),score=38.16 GEZU01010317.1:101-589(-)
MIKAKELLCRPVTNREELKRWLYLRLGIMSAFYLTIIASWTLYVAIDPNVDIASTANLFFTCLTSFGFIGILIAIKWRYDALFARVELIAMEGAGADFDDDAEDSYTIRAGDRKNKKQQKQAAPSSLKPLLHSSNTTNPDDDQDDDQDQQSNNSASRVQISM